MGDYDSVSGKNVGTHDLSKRPPKRGTAGHIYEQQEVLQACTHTHTLYFRFPRARARTPPEGVRHSPKRSAAFPQKECPAPPKGAVAPPKRGRIRDQAKRARGE